jgi:hypothetical protein
MSQNRFIKLKFLATALLALVLSIISFSPVASGISYNPKIDKFKNFETKVINTGIKELDKLFDLIDSAYSLASMDGILTKVDVSNGVKVVDTQISLLDKKIADVNAKIANLLIQLSDSNLTPNLRNSYSSALTSWRSALASYENQKGKLTEAKIYFLSAQNEINSAFEIFLSQKKASPTKTTIASSKNSSPSPQSKSSIEGTICSQPGLTKTSINIKFACLLVDKKYIWVSLNQRTTANPSSASKPSPDKTISEADSLASKGCKAFPSAIVRLQNSSGSSYNSAFVSAQEASFSISQAARLDPKYGVLSNAQYIIIQYAQAVGWGGRGYAGDINTVRTAVATFNSGCNSNLVLR